MTPEPEHLRELVDEAADATVGVVVVVVVVPIVETVVQQVPHGRPHLSSSRSFTDDSSHGTPVRTVLPAAVRGQPTVNIPLIGVFTSDTPRLGSAAERPAARCGRRGAWVVA
jgi:hypothetical protein